MRRKGYGPDLDRVGRNIGDDILGRALRKVLEPPHRRLLLDYLHGAPPEQMAAQLGISLDSLQRLVGRLLAKLRDSEYGSQLHEELHSRFGPRHSSVVWEAAKDVPVHRCERTGCTAPPFTQKPTGRPRRYCSSACRQAAYRGVRRAGPRPASRLGSALGRPLVRREYRLMTYADAPAEFPEPRHTPRLLDGYMAYLEQRLLEWGAPTASPVRVPVTFQAHSWTAVNERFSLISMPGLWWTQGTGKSQFAYYAIQELLQGQHRVRPISLFELGRLGGNNTLKAKASDLPAAEPLSPDPRPTSPLHTPIPSHIRHFAVGWSRRIPQPPAARLGLSPATQGERPWSGPPRKRATRSGRAGMTAAPARRTACMRRRRRR
ncbi:sigma-70 RNA polymerase sigma factor region 4 domain-containing protein [Streptomyces cyaneofuscatus]|uniref:hypothetical protein n=1 Tax=Streptomyces cyaneofuscatus TaxID=66883 RepID=UPI003625F4CE